MEESRGDYPKLKAKLLAKDITLVFGENEYGYEHDTEYVLNGITAETWLAMQDNDDWVKALVGNEAAKKLLSRGRYGLLNYRDRLVVPECLVDFVLRFAYDNNGHIDLEVTRKMLESRVIWGIFAVDTQRHVTGCFRCNAYKQNNGMTRHKMARTPPAHPNIERAVDTLWLTEENTDGGVVVKKNMVYADTFSVYCHLVPLANESVPEIMRALKTI